MIILEDRVLKDGTVPIPVDSSSIVDITAKFLALLSEILVITSTFSFGMALRTQFVVALCTVILFVFTVFVLIMLLDVVPVLFTPVTPEFSHEAFWLFAPNMFAPVMGWSFNLAAQ